jgi:hypothetical protein
MVEAKDWKSFASTIAKNLVVILWGGALFDELLKRWEHCPGTPTVEIFCIDEYRSGWLS